VRKQVKSAPAKSTAKPRPVKVAAKVAPPKPARATKATAKQLREMPAGRDLQKFRELLLAERARLQAELEEIGERTSRATLAERATELSSYEDHPADLASETFEREKDIAIGESVESLLNQVETALEKVERGTYGTCDACGRPIKKARLQALPFATLCLECQGRLES
jgi:RNA polymerase-binding protein DksA